MNTNLNIAINNDFEINQDIKKISKQISKFLKIYSYKSAYLHHETKSIKHSQYLDITAKFFGYSDYNQYNKDKGQNILTIDKIISGFYQFILNLNIDSNYYKGDLEQITKTFYLYLTLTEKELIKKKSNISSKINRRIKKILNNDSYDIENIDIEMYYNVLKRKLPDGILLDYRSIEFEKCKIVNDLNQVFCEYYDYKNTLTIKRYIKEEHFEDVIGKNLYLFEEFVINKSPQKKYLPYEMLEYITQEYRFYESIGTCWTRDLIDEFKRQTKQKEYGSSILIKGIFNSLNDKDNINRKSDITRNKDKHWSSFHINLSNNDQMSFHIYEDGYVTFCKLFNGENEYYDLGFFFSSDNLNWTIPIVERNGRRKERFRFFYPKNKRDQFIFKLSFNEYYGEIILNQDGIVNKNNEVEVSYKEIMHILYQRRLIKLMNRFIEIHNKEDFYRVYFSEEIEDFKLEYNLEKTNNPSDLNYELELDVNDLETSTIKTPIKEDTLKFKIDKIEKEIKELELIFENNYK